MRRDVASLLRTETSQLNALAQSCRMRLLSNQLRRHFSYRKCVGIFLRRQSARLSRYPTVATSKRVLRMETALHSASGSFVGSIESRWFALHRPCVGGSTTGRLATPIIGVSIALHRPCVGGSSDWVAKARSRNFVFSKTTTFDCFARTLISRSLATQSLLPPTRGRWRAR